MKEKCRRLVRRFLYRLGCKRFRNGRFTAEELLASAHRCLRQQWSIYTPEALEAYYNIGGWVRFLEKESDVRSKPNT